jgi:PLP dependent protein
MHKTVQNLITIENEIKSSLSEKNLDKLPKIIAVSKTFSIENILPLIDHGHLDFGENKVQEAIEKWTDIKKNKPSLNLHMLGKLQTNKVKTAVKLFDYIHSLDNEKLAKKISIEQAKLDKKIKIFIQVNIGNEDQKSGINEDNLIQFYNYCKEIHLDIIGLMCLPPVNLNPSQYFKKMNLLNGRIKLNHLSMGMSSDYLDATKNSATYLRIGTNIFGIRS